MDVNTELSFLNCYICFETLKKPKMCPSCSKVACQKCLRTWIEQKRSQCPHCRKTTPLSNFAECERFISDVKHVLQGTDKSQKLKQKCKEHKIEMTYYCQDCQESICSDCGMFGMKHRAHKITHLKKIYQQYKNKILNEITKFDQKLDLLRQKSCHLRIELQQLLSEYSLRKNFIQKYFLAIFGHLEDQFKQKKQKITQQFQVHDKQMDCLENFRDGICKELQHSSEQQLIANSSDIIRRIQSIYHKGEEIQEVQCTFAIIDEIVPKYNQFKYTLKNYHTLGQAIIYSQPYTNLGMQWRLKIYPKGNGIAKDTYMSVFLQLTKAYTSGNKYQYKIQLVSQQNGVNSVIREYSSNFDIGECWGYNQFISIQELNRDFLTDRKDLLFSISMRNPSYRSLVRDQSFYINSLQTKVNNLNNSSKPQDKDRDIEKGISKSLGHKASEQSSQQNQLSKEGIKKSRSESWENSYEQIEEELPKMKYNKSKQQIQEQQRPFNLSLFTKKIKNQTNNENKN